MNIRQVGKKSDLSAFTVSNEQAEALEVLRNIPDENIGIVPCELDGEIVTCVAVMIPTEDGKGQLMPLAILVDKVVFSRIVPLYDPNEEADLETGKNGS